MSPGSAAAVPPGARVFQGRPAGLVTRSIAAGVDVVVVLVVFVAQYAAVAAFLFLVDPRNFSVPDASLLLSMTWLLSIVIVYLALAWWIGGRSYGDTVMGLRVVDRRGRNPRLVLAAVRAGFCAFFPLGLLWVAVSRDRRSVQDVVLRTRVLYDWQPHPDSSAIPSPIRAG